MNRITQLGPVPPPYGGVAVHVERLHELLLEHGFDSQILAVAGRPRRSGRVHLLRPEFVHWPADLVAMVRVVGYGGILHHHSHFTAYPSRRSLEPLLLVASAWRMQWVETFHDETIIVRFPRFSTEQRRLFVRAITSAARVIAIGEPIRDFLLDVGVPPARICVGLPILPIHSLPTAMPVKFERFFAVHSPVWITVGAFDPLYDLHTVIAAFRRLLQWEHRAGLVVAVGRFGIDPDYEQETRAALNDLHDRALLVEDIPNDTLRALFRSSSLLIRGPRLESFGLSRIEAILAGIPVVATDTGATAFMELYEHGDVDSLLEASRRASHAGPETLRRAAGHYRALAEQNLQAILDVYADLGARSGPSGATV